MLRRAGRSGPAGQTGTTPHDLVSSQHSPPMAAAALAEAFHQNAERLFNRTHPIRATWTNRRSPIKCCVKSETRISVHDEMIWRSDRSRHSARPSAVVAPSSEPQAAVFLRSAKWPTVTVPDRYASHPQPQREHHLQADHHNIPHKPIPSKVGSRLRMRSALWLDNAVLAELSVRTRAKKRIQRREKIMRQSRRTCSLSALESGGRFPVELYIAAAEHETILCTTRASTEQRMVRHADLGGTA
jgi:hypothetical protein